MAKFWKVLKVIIFIWGALSLGTILTVMLYVNISERMTTRSVSEPTDEVYEKIFEEFKLTVTHKRGKEAGKVLLTLTKAGNQLARNFALPVKKYGTEWLQVNDSDLIRVSDNEYRIILYGSSDEDSDSSHDSVWFLKYQNQLTVTEVVKLAGIRRINDLDMVILGYNNVGLPYQDDFEYVHFQIPIEVRVGNFIKITPLLSQSGIRLMKKVFDAETQKRMDKLRSGKGKDKEQERKNNETQELIKKGIKEFHEAIQDKNISY